MYIAAAYIVTCADPESKGLRLPCPTCCAFSTVPCGIAMHASGWVYDPPPTHTHTHTHTLGAAAHPHTNTVGFPRCPSAPLPLALPHTRDTMPYHGQVIRISTLNKQSTHQTNKPYPAARLHGTHAWACCREPCHTHGVPCLALYITEARGLLGQYTIPTTATQMI